MKKLHLLGILIIILSVAIFSGCGKNYSDDDGVRNVQEQKMEIDGKEVEMIDVFDKVFDNATWERKKTSDGLDFVIVRGTTEIRQKKVDCEVVFYTRVSVWDARKLSFFRINDIDQSALLGYEYIIKKYKGENVKEVEDQFDIIPDQEECAQFFREVVNQQRKGIDFDEQQYTKMLRKYKEKSILQKIKEQGDRASYREMILLKFAEAIPQDEDVVEVSQIDKETMKITIRTKSIDYTALKNEYEKYAIKIIDEYNGSTTPSRTMEDAFKQYHIKRQEALDRNIKEYTRRYEEEHGNLVGYHIGREELKKKANEEYHKAIEDVQKKILDMVIRESKLKLHTKKIDMVINWRDQKSYQDINVDERTFRDKTIGQILDNSIFYNVEWSAYDSGNISSSSLFSEDDFWRQGMGTNIQ